MGAIIQPMANLAFVAPTVNYKQTTLNGSITSGANTITVNSAANLQAPGYIVIDRQDANGNNTPTAREVVSYTGISSNNLTGCVRGADNSTAAAHNDGALVETMPTVGMWNSLTTIVMSGLDTNGLLNPIASGVSLAIINVGTELNASGASITGTFPLHPVWVMPGFASAASAVVGLPIAMPVAGNWQFFNLISRTGLSGCSLQIDVLKNSVSIFDTGTRPGTAVNQATFASTASIKTKAFIAGDVFTVDIKNGGNVADLTVIGRAIG